MINLELLAELVAFQKYGTLSATANQLKITQPTVSRGMQKLEQELGVSLFDRSVSNHIILNDTGLLAVEEAQKLLQAEAGFKKKIRNYDRQKSQIVVAAVTPGPTMFLAGIQGRLSIPITIVSKLVAPAKITTELANYQAQLIFTNQDLETKQIESMFLGCEHINLGIDKFNPLAQRKSVSFKDLQRLSFLVVENIGPWRKIVEDNIPQARFLYQEDLTSMSELSQYSNFPFFFSNLTKNSSSTSKRFDNGARKPIKINDSHNKLKIFGTYLKSSHRKVQPLLQAIIKNWPK